MSDETILLYPSYTFTNCMSNLVLCLKKYHKNERHLHLATYSSIKPSQNVCLINTHIFMYWYVRCNYKLWNALWFYCVFRVFSYITDDHLCLNCSTSTKLSQIVCLINVHILVYQHAKCNCSLWKDLWFNTFFLAFSYIITCLKRYRFIKLLQIVYYWKVNFCNNLWLRQSEVFLIMDISFWKSVISGNIDYLF